MLNQYLSKWTRKSDALWIPMQRTDRQTNRPSDQPVIKTHLHSTKVISTLGSREAHKDKSDKSMNLQSVWCVSGKKICGNLQFQDQFLFTWFVVCLAYVADSSVRVVFSSPLSCVTASTDELADVSSFLTSSAWGSDADWVSAANTRPAATKHRAVRFLTRSHAFYISMNNI